MKDYMDLLTAVENAMCRITMAKTVLGEACSYVETTDEKYRNLLPYYADDILMLQNATLYLLGDALNVLRAEIDREVKNDG